MVVGTFTDRETVDDIIAHNGESPSGHIAYVKIVEYENYEGRTVWGAVLPVEVHLGIGNRYNTPTEYVRNPRTIWERK